MTNTAFDDLLYPPETRAQDALSGVVAQTITQMAARAGIPKRLMRAELMKLMDAGMVVGQGQYYKLDTGGPWINATEQLPPVSEPHRISLSRSGDGYEVEILEKRDHVAPDPTPPKSPEEGQSELI